MATGAATGPRIFGPTGVQGILGPTGFNGTYIPNPLGWFARPRDILIDYLTDHEKEVRYMMENYKKIESQEKTIADMQEAMKDLLKRLGHLENQVNYAPGGTGYIEAQEHFESLAGEK